jgi:hypothetical protein
VTVLKTVSGVTRSGFESLFLRQTSTVGPALLHSVSLIIPVFGRRLPGVSKVPSDACRTMGIDGFHLRGIAGHSRI